MKGRIIVALALMLCPSITRAGEELETYYKWAISTDAVQWAMLGCINAQLDYNIASKWDISAGIRYNPFTYKRGSAQQTQLRQATPSIGLRYWIDTTYAGWFLEGKILASVYSVANVCNSGCFDGQAVAAGIGAGWSKPLSQRWVLSLSAGILAVIHDTTFYMGPVCGRITGHKGGPAILPDMSLSINYLF